MNLTPLAGKDKKMAFVNEVPTEEEIEKYGLPFGNDKNVKPELRRIWTVDHGRNFHLTVGVSGKQERDEDVKWRCSLYLNGLRFHVFLRRKKGSLVFTDNPYVVRYGAIDSICAIRTDIEEQSIELPKSAWQQPDSPQPLLDGRTFNAFIDILKEGLTALKAGDSNRYIHNPIVVQFDF